MNRETILWQRVFNTITDDEYTGILIESIITARKLLVLNKKEVEIVHDAHDNKIRFESAGYRIKGENTQNTKIFVDIIVNYWNVLKNYLPIDVKNYILLEMA